MASSGSCWYCYACTTCLNQQLENLSFVLWQQRSNRIRYSRCALYIVFCPPTLLLELLHSFFIFRSIFNYPKNLSSFCSMFYFPLNLSSFCSIVYFPLTLSSVSSIFNFPLKNLSSFCSILKFLLKILALFVQFLIFR